MILLDKIKMNYVKIDYLINLEIQNYLNMKKQNNNFKDQNMIKVNWESK